MSNKRKSHVCAGWSLAICLVIALGLLGTSLFLVHDLASAQENTPLGAAAPAAGGWQPLNGPVAEGGQVNALADDPANGGVLYAAVAPPSTSDTGPTTIYKTTDGAVNWTAVFTPEHQVRAMVVAGSKVFAGAANQAGGAGIYAGSTNATTWTTVFSATSRNVWLGLDVHPTDGNTLLAGGATAGAGDKDQARVLLTTNGGTTWTPILTIANPEKNFYITAVMIHPLTPTLWFAAARSEGNPNSTIYGTTDGGVTWPISFTVSGAHILSLAADTTQPNILFAGSGNSPYTYGPSRVFRSMDAGLSWTELNDPRGSYVAFQPPGTVYAVANWGEVFRSPDHGVTWSSVGGTEGPASLALDLGASPSALYVGGTQDGVHKSTDGGATWDERANGLTALVFPIDIVPAPGNVNKLFVAAECLGGWMTADGGQTWVEPGNLSGCMGSFAVNPANPQVVYGGGFDDRSGAIARSTNGGVDFTRVYTAPHIRDDGSGGDEQILTLAVAPSNPAVVYAGGRDSHPGQPDTATIVRSVNDGLTWTPVFTQADTYVETIAVDPVDANVVYAGGQVCLQGNCYGAVVRTRDGGVTWQPTLATSDTVSSLVVDRITRAVYLADRAYTVRKSTDGGVTWAILRQPPWLSDQPSGYLLAADPDLANHILLAGWGYVAETWDGGQTWSAWEAPLNEYTPRMEPGALAMDFGRGTRALYTGFTGVWSYTTEGPDLLFLPTVLKTE